jgi:hypothetical protein
VAADEKWKEERSGELAERERLIAEAEKHKQADEEAARLRKMVRVCRLERVRERLRTDCVGGDTGSARLPISTGRAARHDRLDAPAG